MPKFVPFKKSMGILPYTSNSSPKSISTTPLHQAQQNCWNEVCARAQVKGLVNSKKLSHHTHCTLPHLTLDNNNAKEFLVISQRDSKWVLKVCTKKVASFEWWNIRDNDCSDCNKIFKPHLRMTIMKTFFWTLLWWII